MTMRRGLLAHVMIVIITVMGLVNFFAPFFSPYRTDPLITYFFLLLAGTIAGLKGMAQLLVGRFLPPPHPEEKDPDKKELTE